MKKLAVLLFVFVALSVTAFAADTVETEDFIFSNVVGREEVDGVLHVQGENFITITLNRDLWWVCMYYVDNGQTMAMEPTVTDNYGNLIMDADITIQLQSTGETLDYYEWAVGMNNELYTWDDDPYWLAGSTFTLHIDGEFAFYAYGTEGDYTVYTTEVVEEAPVVIQRGTAKTTASTIYVDGEKVDFDAYKIDGNNYFKLRDVAAAISGSAKEFSVDWDEAAHAISLLSGQGYTANGSELTSGDGTAKDYISASATLYIDGTSVRLTAYEIEGNNYFKLRDLGEIFDFNVSWSEATQTITVDTTASYTTD